MEPIEGLPDDLAPSLGALGEPSLAPELGSRKSQAHRPWWRNLKGPIGVLLADLASPNALVRRRAAEALVRLGDRRALSALAAGAGDPAWEVRLACLRALDRFGGDEAVLAFHRACRDGHAAVRLEAARALARHGTAASVGVLEQLLSYVTAYGLPRDRAVVESALAELKSRLG